MIKRDTDLQNTTETAINYSTCYQLPFLSLYNEDCIETMKRIPDGSIDLMLTDIPYGCTDNKWDMLPNLPLMWQEWERIIKPNGTWIFTAIQPMASQLIITRLGYFKHEIIWEKSNASGFLNADKQPMRAHENILVFSNGKHTYNPQKYKGDKISNKTSLNKNGYGSNYNTTKFEAIQSGGKEDRFPRSVITVNSVNSCCILHPTQKPIDLFRWLILTYSNKGETVFDGYSGSGTTAEACIIEGRKFIGSELNKEYFDKSVSRLKNVPTQLF